MIDIFSKPVEKQSFEISTQIKLYREEEDIKIEKIKDNNNPSQNKIIDNVDLFKLGEIIIKDSKYYYKPNTKDSYYLNFNDSNDDNNIELYSWLIYKGNNFPSNQKKYRIKEGDILKIGRDWLFIKEIYISNKTRKLLQMKNKEKIKGNNFKIFSNPSQTNKDLNINEDVNIIEYNDTNDDKNEEIKLIKNKIETENEELVGNIKHLIVKEKEKNEKKSDFNIDKSKNKKVKICRICYIEEYDQINNPLIKPCKCSGSMKYIHYECLLRWIKTKRAVDKSLYLGSNLSFAYTLRPIECELCKSKLPNYLRHKNEVYSLLNLEKNFDEEINLNKNEEKINKKRKEDKDNYRIFDSIAPSMAENRYRFLVKFDGNNILRIGRGLEMQLVLNDISVSRNHCQLKIENDGSITLEDNSSKFGSLVLIQDEIEILKGHSLNIQVGTNYLTFINKNKSGFFSCCNAEEIDIKNNYETLNSNSVKYNKNNEIIDESVSQENSENEEEENNQIIKKVIDKNEKVSIDKKEENKYDDLIIFNNEKRIKNKRNKEQNNNLDSIYNVSTLMLKDNMSQTKETLNKISNNFSNNKPNMNKIRRGLNELNKNALDGINSVNVIVSEDEESKSIKSIVVVEK